MPISPVSTHRSSVSPFWALLPPLLGLVLYLNVLDNPLIGNGLRITRQNPQVTQGGRWSNIWLASTPPESYTGAYRPVLALLLRAEWKMWEDSPSSFHSVNLLLFAGVILAFYFLLGQIMDEWSSRLIAAVTMALHPMASESIFDVAGQGALLSLLACLVACIVWQFCRQRRLALPTAALLLSLLMFSAAGAHELGLLLPIWLAALSSLTKAELWQEKIVGKKRRSKREAAEPVTEPPRSSPWRAFFAVGLPLLLVIAIYLLLRWKALGGLGAMAELNERAMLGAPGSRFSIGPAVVLAYLFRLFYPVHPTVIYSPAYSASMLPPIVLGWGLLILVIALIVICWRRWPLAALGLILMLTPLLALSHWIPLPFFMSELPLIFALPGLCLIVAGLVRAIVGQGRAMLASPMRQRVAIALFCVVWLALGWQGWARGKDWENPEKLWKAESLRHPANPRPQIELLVHYWRNSNVQAAWDSAAQARALSPRMEDLDRLVQMEAAVASLQQDRERLRNILRDEQASKTSHVFGHFTTLASLAGKNGMPGTAEALWEREIQEHPDSFEAFYELSKLALSRKEYDKALRLAGKAIEAANKDGTPQLRAQALVNYGIILAHANQPVAAAQQLRMALELDDTLYLAYIYLIRIAIGNKDYGGAEGWIAACFNKTRVTSYIDLAQLYVGMLTEQKKEIKAIDWLKTMVNQYPGDILVKKYAAGYLANHGLYAEAEVYCEQLLAQGIQGIDLADVLTTLGFIMLKHHKDPEQAKQLWERALKINPRDRNARKFLQSLNSPQLSSRPPLNTPPPVRTPTPPRQIPRPAARPTRTPAPPTPNPVSPTPVLTPPPVPTQTPAPTLTSVPTSTPIPTLTPTLTPPPTPTKAAASTTSTPVSTPAATGTPL